MQPSDSALSHENLSGIVPNTVDLIWKDMHSPNTGWTVATSAGYPQFQGPVLYDSIHKSSNWKGANIWIEVEEEGDGSSCSATINEATNTRVEIGYIRSWYRLKNDPIWRSMGVVKEFKGKNLPGAKPVVVGGVVFDGLRGCKQQFIASERSTHKNYTTFTTLPNGFRAAKPDHYFRFHGWMNRYDFPNPSNVEAFYGQVYMRLVLVDPNGPYDRRKAHFVAHIASDKRAVDGKWVGAFGMSRYKKITNDWTCFNFMTNITRSDLDNNPPPFSLKP